MVFGLDLSGRMAVVTGAGGIQMCIRDRGMDLPPATQGRLSAVSSGGWTGRRVQSNHRHGNI